MSEYELVHDGESIGSVTIDGGRVDANVDPDVEHAERVEQWVETYDGVQDMEIESGLQGDFPGASDDVDNRVWRPADDDLVRTLCKQTLDTISVEMRASSESASKQQQVEEVPDHAEHLPPDEEPPEDSQVIIGPRGGRYVVEEPVDEEPEDGVPEFDPAEVGPEEAAQILDELIDQDLSEDVDWSAVDDPDEVGVGDAIEYLNPETFEFETGIIVGEDDYMLDVMTAEGRAEINAGDLNRVYEPWEPPEGVDEEEPADEEETVDEEPDGPDMEWFEEVEQLPEWEPESIEADGAVVIDGDVYEGQIDDDGRIGGSQYFIVDGQILHRVGHHLEQQGTQYVEFSEESEYEDGWYQGVADDYELVDGTYHVEVIDENGEEQLIPAGEPEGVHRPVESESIDHDMGTPWEAYEPEYEPAESAPEGVDPESLESAVADGTIDERQQEAIYTGFQKAADVGLLDRTEEVGVDEEMNSIGRYDPEDHSIVFQPEQFTDEMMESLSDEHFVGESLEDVAVHEAMHSLHTEVLEAEMTVEEIMDDLLQQDLPVGEAQIMNEDVSRYAASNPLEVVAEVGTKILRGEEVSDRALYIYEKYGGPEL